MFAASPRQFVDYVKKKEKEPVKKVEDESKIQSLDLRASSYVNLVLLLANVQFDYFAKANATYGQMHKSLSHGLKKKIGDYINEIKKLKGMAAELASVVQNLHGKEEESFNRDCDYLEELIPLFLDRIGDNTRTDFVAQCILHQIYDNYTSKLHQFEEYGHKHLTRSGEEAERIRKINAWRRNEKIRKDAILAGRTAPPELPWPFRYRHCPHK